MGENPSHRDRDVTARFHSVRSFSAQPNYQHPHLQNCRYVCIVSTFTKYLHLMNFHFSLKLTYPIILSWDINSGPETRQGSVCLWVLHTFMLKCVLQYSDTFLFETFWGFYLISRMPNHSLHLPALQYPQLPTYLQYQGVQSWIPYTPHHFIYKWVVLYDTKSSSQMQQKYGHRCSPPLH